MHKKLIILLTIAIFVPLSAFATNFNRSTSEVLKEINDRYGSFYNAPTILSIDSTGTDSDGPLYSTASTWQGFTDDGWDEGLDVADDWIENADFRLNELLNSGLYFRDNLLYKKYWDTVNNGWSGTWYRKNYIRKFAAQAYNCIFCYTDNARYKTTVSKQHVKVPAWLTIFDPIGGSNERNPHTYTRRGPFSKSEFVLANCPITISNVVSLD